MEGCVWDPSGSWGKFQAISREGYPPFLFPHLHTLKRLGDNGQAERKPEARTKASLSEARYLYLPESAGADT